MPRRSSDELDALDQEDRRALQESQERAQSFKIALLMQQGFRQLLFPTGTQVQLQEFERVRGILIANPGIESHVIPHADGMFVYVKPEVISLLQVRRDVQGVTAKREK